MLRRQALEVADVVRDYGAGFAARFGAVLSADQGRVLRAVVS